MAGRCLSASSSQVVTCAMTSLTDHAFVIPGVRTTASAKPAYDSRNAIHGLSSCSRSRRLLSTSNRLRNVTWCGPSVADGPSAVLERSLSDSTSKGQWSLRVVKDHTDCVTATRPQTADAVSKVHAVDTPGSVDGTVADREDHTVTTHKWHDLGSGLHPWPFAQSTQTHRQ